jgi:hypothetical protein
MRSAGKVLGGRIYQPLTGVAKACTVSWSLRVTGSTRIMGVGLLVSGVRRFG